MRVCMLLINFIQILSVVVVAIIIAFIILHIVMPIDTDRSIKTAVRVSELYDADSIVQDALPNHVITIPGWWRYVPFIGTMAATIYPNVYLPVDMYTRFSEGSATFWDRSVLLHEEIHMMRQKTEGLAWHMRYLFLPEYRLTEELISIYIQMKYLKSQGEVYDTTRKAKHFASSAYLWVLSLETAQALLDDLWEKA